MKRSFVRAAALTAVALGVTAMASWQPAPDITASSHRESPLLAFDPQADNTDLYAFVSPDRPDTVTILANYIPDQGPYGAPEYYRFGDDVLYKIHVDNNGDAEEDLTYEFRFTTTFTKPDTFLYVTGPVTSIDDSDLAIRQSYTVDRMEGRTGRMTRVVSNVPVPPAYVGVRSFPDYEAVAAQGIVPMQGGGQVFAGPREEGFFVDVGAAFDLLGVGRTPDDNLAGKNVHTIAMQLPITALTSNGSRPGSPTDPAAVIGVWATAWRQSMAVNPGGRGGAQPARLPNTGDGSLEEDESNAGFSLAQPGQGNWVQVSRLGNPLVNELVIPRGMKDRFNQSHPRDDGQFLRYVVRPELATLLNVVLGFAAPTDDRTDLVQVFLTGIPGATMPPNVKPAEMMRLNVAVPPSASPNRLGVPGGDLAGYPNGRRPADDVTDISLAAVGGLLLGVTAAADLSDGVPENDKPFLPSFPYLATPYSGNP